MKNSVRKAQDALGLFQFGYEDSVIAARVELAVSYVADLRRAWEEGSRK